MKEINVNQSATQMIADINENFSNVGSSTAVLEEQVLPLGDFKKLSSGTYSGWVAQKDLVCPSSHGATYKFKLPNNVVARVMRSQDNSSATYSNELSNGSTFTFSNKADNVQRILFAKKDGSSVDTSITVSELSTMVQQGEVAVMYSDFSVNVNNVPKSALVAWSKRNNSNSHGSFPEPFYKNALLCHISDTHGDITRVSNALKFAKFHECDDVVLSGDAVLYKTEGISHVFAEAENNGQHISYCLGNHESYSGSPQSDYISVMADYGSENGYVGDGVEGAITKGYYYHDITNKKIRMIALNLYEDASYGGGSGKYSWNGKVSQSQIDWFIATLKSTPDGYGVVVLMHQLEGRYKDLDMSLDVPDVNSFYNNPACSRTSNPVDAMNDFDWTKFQDTSYTSWSNGQFVYGRPIADIIDAFVMRKTLDKKYYKKTSYEASPVEMLDIDDDFSSATAHFVCYLIGHSHGDKIGVLSGTDSRQVVCMVTSGNALQHSGGGDLAFSGGDMLRMGKGVAQDAFNLVGIDLDARQMRVVRIGSDLRKDLVKRDYLLMNYSVRFSSTSSIGTGANIIKQGGDNNIPSTIYNFVHQYSSISWKVYASSGYTINEPTASMSGDGEIVVTPVYDNSVLQYYLITTDCVTGAVTITATATKN